MSSVIVHMAAVEHSWLLFVFHGEVTCSLNIHNMWLPAPSLESPQLSGPSQTSGEEAGVHLLNRTAAGVQFPNRTAAGVHLLNRTAAGVHLLNRTAAGVHLLNRSRSSPPQANSSRSSPPQPNSGKSSPPQPNTSRSSPPRQNTSRSSPLSVVWWCRWLPVDFEGEGSSLRAAQWSHVTCVWSPVQWSGAAGWIPPPSCALSLAASLSLTLRFSSSSASSPLLLLRHDGVCGDRFEAAGWKLPRSTGDILVRGEREREKGGEREGVGGDVSASCRGMSLARSLAGGMSSCTCFDPSMQIWNQCFHGQIDANFVNG